MTTLRDVPTLSREDIALVKVITNFYAGAADTEIDPVLAGERAARRIEERVKSGRQEFKLNDA